MNRREILQHSVKHAKNHMGSDYRLVNNLVNYTIFNDKRSQEGRSYCYASLFNKKWEWYALPEAMYCYNTYNARAIRKTNPFVWGAMEFYFDKLLQTVWGKRMLIKKMDHVIFPSDEFNCNEEISRKGAWPGGQVVDARNVPGAFVIQTLVLNRALGERAYLMASFRWLWERLDFLEDNPQARFFFAYTYAWSDYDFQFENERRLEERVLVANLGFGHFPWRTDSLTVENLHNILNGNVLDVHGLHRPALGEDYAKLIPYLRPFESYDYLDYDGVKAPEKITFPGTDDGVWKTSRLGFRYKEPGLPRKEFPNLVRIILNDLEKRRGNHGKA